MNNPMITPCAEWATKLATTHPADLSPSDCDALKAHITSCTVCAAVQHEYNVMDILIRRTQHSIQSTRQVPALPAKLLQLWEKEEQNVSLPAVENMEIEQSSTDSRGYRHPTAIPAAANGVYARTRAMDINMEDLPGSMSLSKLADRCMSEIQKYRRGEPSNDQYALEIFRRAMLHHDERAWELLQQRFQGMMLAWLRRHPRREQALHLDSEENYVAQAFSRFWLTTVRNQELQFTTLAAALDYLRAALSSTIMDVLRAQMRSRELPLPDPGYAGELAQEDEEVDDGLREIIKSLLPNPREQRLADLLFHCNLKPRDILDRCPGEFRDIQEIYRLRRNIMDRLLRYRERLRWLLGDELD